MGEFNAGKWIVGILLYYFVLFLIVFFVVDANNDYGITSSNARFDDPGFANVNVNTEGFCQGSNPSSAIGVCSLTRGDNAFACGELPGCSWNSTDEFCSGISTTLCTSINNETICKLARCQWAVTDVPSSSSLADRGSVSSVRATISFIFGIGAGTVNMDVPAAFVWIFSFIFFWIPFVILMLALYFLLPFFH